VTMTTSVSRLSDDLQNDVEISDSPFNNSFNFNARTDDSVGSTESAFSTPHTGSSLGDPSVPRSRHAEENLRRSYDHHQPQSHYESLDDGHVSRDMEGMSHNLGIRHDAPNNFDITPDSSFDDFPLDNDWSFSAQHHNYPIDQALPARSLYDNSVTELQDGTCGVDDSMINEFSDHFSWRADDYYVPLSQTPLYSLRGREASVPRQLSTPLIEDQNAPPLMTTCPHIASRNMHAIEPPNMSLQGINSQDSQDLDASLGLLEPDSLSVGPDQLGPITDVDLYIICPDPTPPIQGNVWPPNPVATSSYENGPSSALHLLPTSHSSSAFADMNENRAGSTTAATNPTCQKSLSTLPAFEKSYTRTLHASNGLAQLQQVYGPQEAQLRRSDRRPLTEQERENASRVRQIGSCLVCTLKKQKVIAFLDARSKVLAD